ncbi:hypothetical protein BDV28DRAFT_146401 [Aspergillus coremiiformis]|uniref:Uncharacterized protein n=1 Tax=Aspergillus coremiiformis TaxID=138285 RepID=A0A5N6ZG59_9EURO|nr:hypothetical protein BDV28DRAFT_146401 [Aspergillus coremiiformis]
MTDQRESSLSSLPSDCSEEERKPVVSPVTELQTTTGLLVANPQPLFGPDRSLPQHLVDLLEEWHKTNGTKHPPCTNRPRSTLEWKTFDRQGNHVDLSSFAIQQPARYNILVLHPIEGPEKLVGYYFANGSKYGYYLQGWMGIHNGWEPTSSAVRKYAAKLDDIQYEPQAWSDFEDRVKQSTENHQSIDDASRPETRVLRTATKRRSLPGTLQVQRPETRSQRTSLPEWSAASYSHMIADMRETASSSSGFESSGSSENDSSSDSEDETAFKRRRLTEPSAASNEDSKVIFKLVSYKSGAIRCFPLEECKTGKELFDKAQNFFRLFDRKAEVKILSCQITSQSEQQYVFEGSEGEFSLLVKRVKSLIDTDEVFTIEVGHVLGHP